MKFLTFREKQRGHRGRRGQGMRDTKNLPKGRLPVASENEEGIGPAMLLLPLNASLWPTWEFLWDSPGARELPEVDKTRGEM